MKQLHLLGVFVVAVIGCAKPVLGQAGAPCADASMLVVKRLTPFIAGVVSGTSSESAQQRSELQLPVASASDVILVQDPAVCQSASASFARVALSDTTLVITPMVVLRVGSRYVVSPADMRWRFHPITIFDLGFTYKYYFAM